AAAVANGADWPTATQLDNVAAGLEVEKFGVVPIALDEVMINLLKYPSRLHGKERTLDQAVLELHALRRQGRTIAFTHGCFDSLGAQHVRFFRDARARADLLVVAVQSDAAIRRAR